MELQNGVTVHLRGGCVEELRDMWYMFAPLGVGVEFIDGYLGWRDASAYLYDLVDANEGFVVNCDTDCFVYDWAIARELVGYMMRNGYSHCGVRDDAGTIPHRTNSRDVMNPFFGIFNTSILRDLPDVLRVTDGYEPFNGFYEYINRNYRPLYLGARQCLDGVSTELLFRGRSFCVHSWYGREFEEHRERIRAVHSYALTKKIV